jgi:hypothetical protein
MTSMAFVLNVQSRMSPARMTDSDSDHDWDDDCDDAIFDAWTPGVSALVTQRHRCHF